MFTGTKYDGCTVATAFSDNTTLLSHVMDIRRHAHDDPCSHGRGILGGPSVATAGDLGTAGAGLWNRVIAVESDLRGQTRGVSRCPAFHYLPGVHPVEPVKPVRHPAIRADGFRAPPACEMIQPPAGAASPAESGGR